MLWISDQLLPFVATLFSQNPPGSGSSLEIGSLADWANVIVAFLSMAIAFGSFWFAVHIYRQQQEMNRRNLEEEKEKDRLAEQQQRDRDQVAKIELERVRQQTIRLAWYRDIVRPRLDDAHKAFKKFHLVRDESVALKTDSTLTDEQKKSLSKKYRQIVGELRNQLLDYIVQIHVPTNRKLLTVLDELVTKIDRALYNSKHRLSNEEVYEDEIGQPIAACQERFFQILYAYQGDENPEKATLDS